jgi:hypothetical protein
MTEDGVLAIQPWVWDVGDEELASVGPGPALAMERMRDGRASTNVKLIRERISRPPVPLPMGHPPWIMKS